MTNRDNLNRLNVSILKSIATEHGVDVNKKKKADIIADILTCQAPVSALTPVVHRTSEIEAITPASTTGNIEENLPPFNKVSYLNDAYSTHVINFSQIYDFMVSRKRDSGESVSNFKGLDRAVKHFSADVHIIGIAKVPYATSKQNFNSEYLLYLGHIMDYVKIRHLLTLLGYSWHTFFLISIAPFPDIHDLPLQISLFTYFKTVI